MLGLTLLSPLWAWLLPLAALPVVFHFAWRRRRKRLVLPSLLFFQQIEPRLQARSRLRELLVLALRTLLLLAAILALAHPLWQGVGGGGGAALALVIDDSASMGAPAPGAAGTTRLALAVDAATALVAALRPGDRAAVVLTVPDPLLPPPELTADKDRLRALLARLRPTEGASAPGPALASAAMMLSADTAPRREIQVFSDCQAHDWSTGTALSPTALPAGTALALHRVPALAVAGDAALAAVDVGGRAVLAGRPVPLRVGVDNPGSQDVAVTVSALDDAGHQQTCPLSVPAHAHRELPLVLPPSAPGRHWARVWLDGDRFAGDDEAFAAWTTAGRRSVLLVGEGRDFGVLPLALAPVPDGSLSGLVPQPCAPSALAAALVPAPPAATTPGAAAAPLRPALVALTWTAAAGLDAATASALQDYLGHGGRVLLVPRAGDPTGGGALPAWCGAHAETPARNPAGIGMTVLDPGDALFRDLVGPDGSVAIGAPRAFAAIPLHPDSGTHALLGLADGRPLITGRRVAADGGGADGWVFTSGLAFAPSWSTLPLNPGFLALAQGFALAAPGDDGVERLLGGGAANLPPTLGGDTPVQVRTVAGAALDWRGPAAKLPSFPRAGVYTVTPAAGNAATEITVAVRCDPGEGDPVILDRDRVAPLQDLGATTDDLSTPDALVRAWRRARTGLDLLPWLLALAALALAAEGFVANAPVVRPAKPRVSGGPGAASGSAIPAVSRASGTIPAATQAVEAASTSLGALAWQPHAPPLVLALVALALGAWAVFLHRRLAARHGAAGARRLLAPKIVVAALVLVALLDPGLTKQEGAGHDRQVFVLIDQSSSMEVRDLPDHAAGSRRARAEKIADGLTAPSGVVLTRRWFDTALHRDPAAPTATGERGTDLGACLQAVAREAAAGDCAGVIVLSDGGDETLTPEGLPTAPISTVAIGGDPAGWTNLALSALAAPANAERGVSFTIGVDCAAQGSDAFRANLSAVPLTLRRESAPGTWTDAGSATVDLSHGRAHADFPLQVAEAGIARFRVDLAVQPNELSALDNRRTCEVEIQERNLHVLYFTRVVGLDYKFLRAELARDPGITFTALLRTGAGRLGERYTVQGDAGGGADLSAGLPTAPNALARFDCIILGAFPANDWDPAAQQALADYVNGGGALAVLGGENAFGSGGWAAGPLAPLMPWQIADGTGDLERGTFPLAIPPAAAGHPILQGVSFGAQAQLASRNRPGALRGGAVALVTATGDGGTQAVIAAELFGKGRVLGVATDTLWRLARTPEGPDAGGGEDAYGRFWRQAVRWLADRGEGSRALRVTWDRQRWRPGETARAEIRADGPVQLTTTLDRETTSASAPATTASASAAATDDAPNHRDLTAEPIANEPGAQTLAVPFAGRGRYHLRVVAYRDGAVLDTYERGFDVAPALPEGARLARDDAGLEHLATTHGGIHVGEESPAALAAWLAGLAPAARTLGVSSLILDTPWWLAALVAALLWEWLLRRKKNLI
jgi:uncharacterized membrane protein